MKFDTMKLQYEVSKLIHITSICFQHLSSNLIPHKHFILVGLYSANPQAVSMTGKLIVMTSRRSWCYIRILLHWVKFGLWSWCSSILLQFFLTGVTNVFFTFWQKCQYILGLKWSLPAYLVNRWDCSYINNLGFKINPSSI